MADAGRCRCRSGLAGEVMRFGPAVSRVGVIFSQQIDWFLGLRATAMHLLCLCLRVLRWKRGARELEGPHLTYQASYRAPALSPAQSK